MSTAKQSEVSKPEGKLTETPKTADVEGQSNQKFSFWNSSSKSGTWCWSKDCKADCNDCPYSQFICNPCKKNKYGYDALTELSWRLTMWKKENVFPIDLKVRAPVVFLSTLLIMKGEVIRIPRIQQGSYWTVHLFVVGHSLFA